MPKICRPVLHHSDGAVFSVIIVIERNLDDGKVTQRAVATSMPGVICSFADSSRDAVDRTRDQEVRDRVRVILLTLDLADGPGFDQLEALTTCAWLKGIPIVCLSSRMDARHLLTAYELGARSVLFKPADYVELEEMLTVAATFWLRMSMSPRREALKSGAN
jgi:DNA-binding response OmpR family regulator